MKVRADENVSIRLVRAMSELGLRSGWELSHVRESHEAGTADETWLTHFAAEGGVAIISADGRMLKRPNQLVAIRDAGLACVILSSQWVSTRKFQQAACLMFWWPKIENALEGAKPGDCWRVPLSFERAAELVHKCIDYDSAAASIRRGSLSD